VIAAGQKLAGYTAGDWRAGSRWAAGLLAPARTRPGPPAAGRLGCQPGGGTPPSSSTATRPKAGACATGTATPTGSPAPTPRRKRRRSYDLRPSSRARMVPVRRIPPRSCAAEVTVTRQRWTGERIPTTRDRQNEPERQAHGGPGLEAEAEL